MKYIIQETDKNGKLTVSEIQKIVQKFVNNLSAGTENILIIPPDKTRKHSGAGSITQILYNSLKDKENHEFDIDIMPALGTHQSMSNKEIKDMFGDKIPLSNFIEHKWREDTVKIGEISSEKVSSITEGLVEMSVAVNVNERLLDDKYDLLISIGQVLPHEVVGMANYNKNIFVGCGGEDIINKSHFVGAAYGMEKLLGKDHSPVRKLYDYAEREFFSNKPLVYFLSVNSTEINPSTGLTDWKGFYIGEDREIFEKAVALSQKVNIEKLEKPLSKVVVYLEEEEFTSTWLGCKAIYRTRKVIEDGGELIIIAPGLKKFGEDPQNDKLIRKYGYTGKENILKLVKERDDLQENLSVAAHLIHGSAEGRFKVKIACNKLSRKEVENVNFDYLPLERALNKYDIENLESGFNEIGEERIYYIENPATGLWDLKQNYQ